MAVVWQWAWQWWALWSKGVGNGGQVDGCGSGRGSAST